MCVQGVPYKRNFLFEDFARPMLNMPTRTDDADRLVGRIVTRLDAALGRTKFSKSGFKNQMICDRVASASKPVLFHRQSTANPRGICEQGRGSSQWPPRSPGETFPRRVAG